MKYMAAIREHKWESQYCVGMGTIGLNQILWIGINI